MSSASHSVVISRPPSEVFAFVADGEQCPRWRSGVVEIQRVSGSGDGTRYRQLVRGPGGRSIAADYVITAYQPDRLLEFQTTAGPVRPHGRYDLEPVDGGTRLTFSLDAPLGAIQRLLMGSMVQKTMDAEVRAIEKLKAVVEAAPASPSAAGPA